MKDDLFFYPYPYRYCDTMEPAIILLADASYRNDQVFHVAARHSSLTRGNEMFTREKELLPVNMFLCFHLTESELDVWRAFDLCPVVKIWHTGDRFFTEHVAP
jgi:hypothetical protein